MILFYLYVLFIRPYVLARKKFKCLRCGLCCGLKVKLSKEEIKKIKKAGYSDFITKHGYIKRKNKYCQFLKFKGNITECSLEKIKPKICKKFPEISGLFGKQIDVRCKTCHKKLW